MNQSRKHNIRSFLRRHLIDSQLWVILPMLGFMLLPMLAVWLARWVG